MHQVLGGLTIGNGLAWDASGRVMDYIDTPTQRVDAVAFEPATGALSDRRALPDIS